MEMGADDRRRPREMAEILAKTEQRFGQEGRKQVEDGVAGLSARDIAKLLAEAKEDAEGNLTAESKAEQEALRRELAELQVPDFRSAEAKGMRPASGR